MVRPNVTRVTGLKGGYRPEIDGMRCVAILPVVLYHAGFELFGHRLMPGGFLGVDVFFVISGYLITGIVLSQMSNGTWSIGKFYERRARRILPALFAMMAVGIPFALWLMSPAQLQNLGWSTLATTLFGSNIQLWLDTGYFSEAIDLKPLAHMWSLAVEEQFYLAFPLLLWALFRLGRQRQLSVIIIAAALLSLASAQFIGPLDPNANFYLLPTRAWELLGGALLAVLERQDTARPTGWKATVLASLGLTMVLASMIVIDGTAPHPGLVTTPVVVGSMLVIWCSPGSRWPRQVLSWPPLVGVGLISYSL
jgi:peptidoglycan/LPS O-acetylase OafA/YrhL